MAKFGPAHLKMLKVEDFYSNDKGDRGGETIWAIAREKNPAFPGWRIVDQYRDHPAFPDVLKSNTELMEMIDTYLKKNYWDIFCGDLIENDDLAWELYDISINIGPMMAAYWLQQSLNLLNCNQRDYPDIVVDGVMKPGGITLKTLDLFLKKRSVNLLIKVLNSFQGEHYRKLMKKNPEDEKWIGWFERI
jgi:lysozyme family protein